MRMNRGLLVLCISFAALSFGCDGPPPTKSWDPQPPGTPCASPGENWWTCRRLLQGPSSSQPDQPDAGYGNGGVDGGCLANAIYVCVPPGQGSSYAQYLATKAYVTYADVTMIPDDYKQLNILCQPGQTGGGFIAQQDYPVCTTIEPAGSGAGGGPAVSCGGDLAACSNDSDCCSGICSLNACGGQPGQTFDGGGAGGAGGGGGGAP